jgi:CIC family chloride channel protein
MLTVVITTIISQRLLKGESIYTLKLSRRGVRLNRGRDVDVMEGVLVSEVMSHEYNIISTEDSLTSFSNVLDQSHSHGALILDKNGRFWGIITFSDLERAISNQLNLDEVKVTAIGSHGSDLLVAYPDETIGQALYRMSPRDLGRLPVVSRKDPHQLLGLIRREEIIRAYYLALTRRAEITHRAKQLKIDDEEELEIIHLTIVDGAKISGKSIKEFAGEMPPNSLLVSIKRDGRTLIPHGDTKISSGDSVSIILKNEDIEKIYKLFHS